MTPTPPAPPAPTGTGGPPTDPEVFKKISRQIDQAFEEAAKLAGSGSPPAQFFQEFLAKSIGGISARAGAIWMRTPQGFLQLQCQLNIEGVGLDQHPNGRQSHNELLRQAFQTGRPMLLEPYSGTAILEGTPAGNPTQFACHLAPILDEEKKPLGILEIWQDPKYDPRAQRTFLNYLVQMAGYASQYLKGQSGKQQVNQEQVWTQLETFAASVHKSLNVTETAYTVANEGRRLIGCDRLSVAVREGSSTKIEAVSGADTVEKRSTLVTLMRKLADSVIKWGEKLVYRGTKDEGLPPSVLAALDDYLAESNSKLLVVLPLVDEREKPKENPTKPQQVDPLRKARSALVMESFEPPPQVEPLIQRTEVVGRHAGTALFNAVELRRIPMGFIWKPLAAIQDGLGGKTKAIIALIAVALTGLITAMVLVPYSLKLDAKGNLLPKERVNLFSPTEAQVLNIGVGPGDAVQPGHPLMDLRSVEVEKKLLDLHGQMAQYQARLTTPPPPAGSAPDAMMRYQRERGDARIAITAVQEQIETLTRAFNLTDPRSGLMTLKAPAFDPTQGGRMTDAKAEWTVMDSPGFQENLKGRNVRQSDPLLRLGNKNGVWEIQLKIPQKHIGQLLQAFPKDDPNAELDVDLVLRSQTTKTFKGKLLRRDIASEATPDRDEHNESEPVVVSYVRVSGPGIAPEDTISREQLLAGVEVVTRIRCGTYPMGYSLFYGVWDFLAEKLFQWF